MSSTELRPRRQRRIGFSRDRQLLADSCLSVPENVVQKYPTCAQRLTAMQTWPRTAFSGKRKNSVRACCVRGCGKERCKPRRCLLLVTCDVCLTFPQLGPAPVQRATLFCTTAAAVASWLRTSLKRTQLQASSQMQGARTATHRTRWQRTIIAAASEAACGSDIDMSTAATACMRQHVSSVGAPTWCSVASAPMPQCFAPHLATCCHRAACNRQAALTRRARICQPVATCLSCACRLRTTTA